MLFQVLEWKTTNCATTMAVKCLLSGRDVGTVLHDGQLINIIECVRWHLP